MIVQVNVIIKTTAVGDEHQQFFSQLPDHSVYQLLILLGPVTAVTYLVIVLKDQCHSNIVSEVLNTIILINEL